MQVIDTILELLKDGDWHTLAEIIRQTSLQEPEAHLILEFLSTHQFIQVDPNSQQVKLCSATRKFLEDIQPIEAEDMTSLRLR